MKKIIMLVIILCMLLCQVCNAFESLDPERWSLIGYSDKFEYWFDSYKSYFSKTGDDNYMDLWLLMRNKKESTQSLQHWKLNFSKQEIKVVSYTYYDKNGKLKDSFNGDRPFKKVQHNSMGEVIYDEMLKEYKAINERKDKDAVFAGLEYRAGNTESYDSVLNKDKSTKPANIQSQVSPGIPAAASSAAKPNGSSDAVKPAKEPVKTDEGDSNGIYYGCLIVASAALLFYLNNKNKERNQEKAENYNAVINEGATAEIKNTSHNNSYYEKYCVKILYDCYANNDFYGCESIFSENVKIFMGGKEMKGGGLLSSFFSSKAATIGFLKDTVRYVEKRGGHIYAYVGKVLDYHGNEGSKAVRVGRTVIVLAMPTSKQFSTVGLLDINAEGKVERITYDYAGGYEVSFD